MECAHEGRTAAPLAPQPPTFRQGAMSPRPAFLVTIDTEGDDLWSRPREIGTRNAAFLPRFQALCEAHGLKPTEPLTLD